MEASNHFRSNHFHPTEEKDKLDNLVDCIIGIHQTSDEENKSFKKSTVATSGKSNMNVDLDLH